MTLDPVANAVTIELGGSTVAIAETYEISIGMMQVPAAFALRLGYSGSPAALAFLYPPRTPFRLLIGGVLQFSGKTDGYTLESGPGGATITLRGRDALADLVDGFVTTERSFTNPSVKDVVDAVMTEVYGAGNEPDLFFTNESNRKVVAGVSVTETAPPAIDGENPAIAAAKPSKSALQAKLGQRWYSDFLKPELDRLGFFLFAGANGELVLTSLNGAQQPTYRIQRKRDAKITSGVVSGSLKHETTNRYTSAEVHCRSGGGAEARTKSVGFYEDQEMKALGYTRRFVDKDSKAKNIGQAQFLARRKIAEACRSGWSLTYEVSGHVGPTVDGGFATWAPDTVVNIDDDELGLLGDFYIESVRPHGGPEKRTTLEVMRLDDLVFGDDPGKTSGIGGAAKAPPEAGRAGGAGGATGDVYKETLRRLGIE